MVASPEQLQVAGLLNGAGSFYQLSKHNRSNPQAPSVGLKS